MISQSQDQETLTLKVHYNALITENKRLKDELSHTQLQLSQRDQIVRDLSQKKMSQQRPPKKTAIVFSKNRDPTRFTNEPVTLREEYDPTDK